MTWRVVIADKVAKSGLDLLAATPEVELVSVAGKPREELERALAGAHALIVRRASQLIWQVAKECQASPREIEAALFMWGYNVAEEPED